MDESALAKYENLFRRMNRAVVKGYKAPHKPVLLIAICELVANGQVADNRIYLTKSLEDKYKEIWKEFIDSNESVCYDCVAEELFGGEKKTYPFKCNIANPFYHLSGEPFWTLKKSPQWRQRSSWSVSALKSDYEYAIMEADLFDLMADTNSHKQILSILQTLI